MLGDKVFSLEELSDLTLQCSGMSMAYEAVLRGIINAEPADSPVIQSVIEWLRAENTRIESITESYKDGPTAFREAIYRIFQYRTDIDLETIFDPALKAVTPPAHPITTVEPRATVKPRVISKQELLCIFLRAIRNAHQLDSLSVRELKILLALGYSDDRWVEMSNIRSASMGPGESTFPKHIRNLTQLGLVAKRVAPNDMRRRELSLTKKGREQVSVIYKSAIDTLEFR